MIVKYTSWLTLLMLCLVSCTQENQPDEVKNGNLKKQVVVSLSNTKSLSNGNSDDISKIDVISFARKNNEAEYTYETRIEGIVPTTTEGGEQITLTLDGSLPRIFYLIANADSRITVTELSSTTTAEEFENGARIKDEKTPVAPYIMMAKKELNEPAIESNIEVKFNQALACLDIENGYSGFMPDSIVLQDAKAGTYLFNENLPTGSNSINYGNTSQMLMYPAKEANLAIYGKKSGVRMAFDIPLNNIEKGTRYKVSFRGANDLPATPGGELQWKVTLWNTGAVIAATPDWNRN